MEAEKIKAIRTEEMVIDVVQPEKKPMAKLIIQPRIIPLIPQCRFPPL
jgi:hypothetical protein